MASHHCQMFQKNANHSLKKSQVGPRAEKQADEFILVQSRTLGTAKIFQWSWNFPTNTFSWRFMCVWKCLNVSMCLSLSPWDKAVLLAEKIFVNLGVCLNVKVKPFMWWLFHTAKKITVFLSLILCRSQTQRLCHREEIKLPFFPHSFPWIVKTAWMQTSFKAWKWMYFCWLRHSPADISCAGNVLNITDPHYFRPKKTVGANPGLQRGCYLSKCQSLGPRVGSVLLRLQVGTRQWRVRWLAVADS